MALGQRYTKTGRRSQAIQLQQQIDGIQKVLEAMVEDPRKLRSVYGQIIKNEMKPVAKEMKSIIKTKHGKKASRVRNSIRPRSPKKATARKLGYNPAEPLVTVGPLIGVKQKKGESKEDYWKRVGETGFYWHWLAYGTKRRYPKNGSYLRFKGSDGKWVTVPSVEGMKPLDWTSRPYARIQRKLNRSRDGMMNKMLKAADAEIRKRNLNRR